MPVKIGVRRDARVEIVEGLQAGDQVVTAGMRLSRDGQPVTVVSQQSKALDQSAAAKKVQASDTKGDAARKATIP